MAEALYRKYRPQVFEDVVGQEPIERTLKNAIRQDKVSHAYLFCGPRGTGKTTTARLLAKALLCEQGPTPEPDGSCEDCQLVADGVHPDVYELDAASRTGVENVREEIISRVQFAPTRGRYKVYIIDEVHMLSVAAFNALLKTLEEPPTHVVFILCTTDPHKVPETIHSRCQRFDFRRIAPESMVSRLGAICIAEGVEFEGEALDLIAHRADGGLRNALTSLEQIIAFEGGKVTLAGAERLLGSIDSNDMAEIMAYVGKRDIANCFRWTAAYVETGADLAQFVRDMAEHVRNLYILSLVGDDAVLDVSETVRRELSRELAWYGSDRLARLLGVLGDLIGELKTSSNPRLSFEIALTRMVRPDSDLTIEALAERIEALEAGYSAVAHVLPGPRYESEAPRAAVATDRMVQPERAPVDPTQNETTPAASASASGLDSAPVATKRTGAADSSDSSQRPALKPASAQVQQEKRGNQQDEVRASQGVAAHESGVSEADAVGAPGVSAASASVAALANPASLQRTWQAVLATLKRQKASYGVLFLNTKVTYDDDSGALNIAFPSENAFTYKAVQKADVQDALAAALVAVTGKAVPFACTQGTSAQSQVAVQVQPHEPAHAAESAPAPVRPIEQASDSGAAADAYDEEPYEDEYVPYEVDGDYDDYSGVDPSDGIAYDEWVDSGYQNAQQNVPVLDGVSSSGNEEGDLNATTSATPSTPSESPDGTQTGDGGVDDIEAMLQAGFGGTIVFEEID